MCKESKICPIARSIIHGSRNFRQGGPGQSDKKVLTTSKNSIIFQGSRGGPTFSRGSNFFQGGGGAIAYSL